MAKPEATPSSCLSSILQRLLCARNLPPRRCYHESSTTTSTAADRVVSKTAAGEEEEEEEEEAAAPPGIVARLMGLETMPDLPLTPPKVPNPNSLLCRSMNSVEYLLQLEQMQTSGSDRQQRTLSFREEVPTFLRLQNRAETERLGRKQGKTGEMKQGCKDFNPKLTKAETGENCSGNRGDENKTRKASDCKRNIKEDSRGSRHVSRKSILIPKERPNPKTLIKEELARESKSSKKKKKKSADSESASAAHAKNHHVSGEHSMGIGMDGKKRKPEDYVRGWRTDHPETRSVVVRNRGGGGGVEMGIGYEAEYYYCAEMVRQVCALSADDIKKWNWGGGKKGWCEDYEELCVEFGDQIVQQMVCQVVHELSRTGLPLSAAA